MPLHLSLEEYADLLVDGTYLDSGSGQIIQVPPWSMLARTFIPATARLYAHQLQLRTGRIRLPESKRLDRPEDRALLLIYEGDAALAVEQALDIAEWTAPQESPLQGMLELVPRIRQWYKLRQTGLEFMRDYRSSNEQEIYHLPSRDIVRLVEEWERSANNQ
jgi:hypothetical protein